MVTEFKGESLFDINLHDAKLLIHCINKIAILSIERL